MTRKEFKHIKKTKGIAYLSEFMYRSHTWLKQANLWLDLIVCGMAFRQDKEMRSLYLRNYRYCLNKAKEGV